MTETLLEITGVVAGYGYGDILRGTDLQVPKGAVTCLIGPNGAGKSTLLRAISGLIKVQAGSIVFQGIDLARRSPGAILAHGIVHVPQDRSLFPGMTVWENLLMGGYILRDRALLNQRVAQVLDRFPTAAEFRNAKAGALSGGQQRIVEVARAMVLDPVLILLDEPSLGLDPKSRRLVFDTARSLADDGRTVLMVEQNARSGLAISHFGAVMDLGVVRLQDRAEDLVANPEVGRLYLGASAAAHRRLPHAVHQRT